MSARATRWRTSAPSSSPSLELIIHGRLQLVFTVHATNKLLVRVKAIIEPVPPDATTALGNWYAALLAWRPHVALFVNEATLLPVLVPLAPSKSLLVRLPEAVEAVLNRLGVDPRFVAAERDAMQQGVYAKTRDRSLIGMLNEFSFLAGVHRDHDGQADLTGMALRLATTPCGPLHKRQITPECELLALVTTTMEHPG